MRGATILHMVPHLEVLAAATQLMLLCHYRAALLVHYFHLMVLVELLGIVEVTLLMLDGTRDIRQVALLPCVGSMGAPWSLSLPDWRCAA